MISSFTRRITYGFLITFGILAGSSQRAAAQLNSGTGSIALTATLGEVLTVAATPSAVTFALVAGGTASGSAPVAITTSWIVSQARANLVLDAYFSSTTLALSGGSPVVKIPPSEVFGQVTTGTPTTFTAFTQTGVLGTAGAGLALFTQALTSLNVASTRSDNLSLQDQSNRPAPGARRCLHRHLDATGPGTLNRHFEPPL